MGGGRGEARDHVKDGAGVARNGHQSRVWYNGVEAKAECKQEHAAMNEQRIGQPPLTNLQMELLLLYSLKLSDRELLQVKEVLK